MINDHWGVHDFSSNEHHTILCMYCRCVSRELLKALANLPSLLLDPPPSPPNTLPFPTLKQSRNTPEACQSHFIEITIFQVKRGAVLKYYLAGKNLLTSKPPTRYPTQPLPLTRYCRKCPAFVRRHALSQSAVNTNMSVHSQQQSHRQTSPHLSVNPSNLLARGVLTYVWFSSRFPSQFGVGAAVPAVLTHPATLRLIHRKPSPGMPCWPYVCVCVCVHVFFCQYSIYVFHLCCTDGTPQPLTTCRPNSVEYGLSNSLGFRVTLWLLDFSPRKKGSPQGRLVGRETCFS